MGVETKTYVEFTCDICGRRYGQALDAFTAFHDGEYDDLDDVQPQLIPDKMRVVRVTSRVTTDEFVLCDTCALRAPLTEILHGLYEDGRSREPGPTETVQPTAAGTTGVHLEVSTPWGTANDEAAE